MEWHELLFVGATYIIMFTLHWRTANQREDARADRDLWRRKAEARNWGPVVTIRSEDRGYGLFCNTNCDFSSKYLCPHQTGHSTSGTYHPKDDCPKPAPVGKQWQLCLVDKEDTND